MSAEKLNLTYHSNCITLDMFCIWDHSPSYSLTKSQKYLWKNVVISNIADYQPATLLKIRFLYRRL